MITVKEMRKNLLIPGSLNKFDFRNCEQQLKQNSQT